MTKRRVETKAGAFSRSDALAQLTEHLRLAAENAYMISHHDKADNDIMSGEQFLKVGLMLERTCELVSQLFRQSFN